MGPEDDDIIRTPEDLRRALGPGREDIKIFIGPPKPEPEIKLYEEGLPETPKTPELTMMQKLFIQLEALRNAMRGR